MTPRVSVVVPTHDTWELTRRCLASLREQTFTDYEVILVDDGGSDGTDQAVQEAFPEVHLLRNECAEGFTRAANRGASAARGDVLLLLNSDTELPTHGLADIAAAFAGDERLGVAGMRLVYPDGRAQWSAGPTPTGPWFFALASGLGTRLHGLPGYSRLRRSRARDCDWVSGAAMAIRRATWDAVGPFDERFNFYAQDLDLCLLAQAAGWRVEVLDGVPVLHHHGASVARSDGSFAQANFPMLWSDLLRWARKHGGPDFERRARQALRRGAAVRRCLLAVETPFAGRRRNALRAERAAIRAALLAISPADHGPDDRLGP